MNDKIRSQVEWVISKLLRTSENFIISIRYEKEKNEARIYLDGKKMATISEEVCTFGWPLTKEEIEKLYETLYGKKYHIEIPGDIKQILSILPSGQWYSVIWDSDGDFLVTNTANRKYLTDLFCELKRLKGI